MSENKTEHKENTVVTQTNHNEKEKTVSTEQLKQAPANVSTENFAEKLQCVLKERIDKIAECNAQAAKWQDYSRKLQDELAADLAKIQSQLGIKVTVPAKKKKSATKNFTAPQLIRAFLEKHGTAKTSEIREFLISKGKKTNPGVALSRLVKEGVILNTERGTYKLA